jgi:ubiquitin-protein ligase
LEKLQAEIERMEAEAARITKETEDLEKGKPSSSSAAKKEDPKDVAKRDG